MINLVVGMFNGAVAFACFKQGVTTWAWINLVFSAMNIALFLSTVL